MTRHDRHELDRLQDAFSSEKWGEPGADCPDEETLWASAAGELPPEEDHAVVLHLAGCPRCAPIWRLAREMIVPGEEMTVVPLDAGRGTRPWQRPALLAAAAVVILGIGLGSILLHRGAPPSPPVYRQQTEKTRIVASPDTRQLPRTACRLRWSAGPEGTHYDLTVCGKDLSIVTVVKGLKRPEYVLPPERIPEPAGEILWRVTAHLPDGHTVTSRTFTSRIAE